MSRDSDPLIAFPATLLTPAPIALETGVQRLASGALLVAVRNHLPGCSGVMFDWWFKHFTTDNDLRLWHPADHKAHLGWDENWQPGKSYIGATIHAVEALGDIPPVPAVLKFIDPHDFLATRWMERRSLLRSVPGSDSASIRCWIPKGCRFPAGWRTSAAIRKTDSCCAAAFCLVSMDPRCRRRLASA